MSREKMLKYNAITVHGPEGVQWTGLNQSVIDDENVVWREPSHMSSGHISWSSNMTWLFLMKLKIWLLNSAVVPFIRIEATETPAHENWHARLCRNAHSSGVWKSLKWGMSLPSSKDILGITYVRDTASERNRTANLTTECWVKEAKQNNMF